MNFDEYYLMYLGVTPPSSDEPEEPEEDKKPSYFSSYVSVYVKPDPPPPVAAQPIPNGGSGVYLPDGTPIHPVSPSGTSTYDSRPDSHRPGGKPADSSQSASDISETERPLDDRDSYPVHPGTIVDDLQDLRPEYNDDLSQTYEEAYKNENDIYFQLYLSQSTVRRNDFAESGLDEDSDERAEERIWRRVERVRRETMTDLADDRWESIVAIDTKTGEKVFRRYGSKNYTFLQEENRKMVEGREIALIHNHPNNTAASQTDLEGAFWLGAKSLTVVTPSGYRYVYIRGTHEMELAAIINDPNYVANPSWREDVESSTAFWTQTLAEKGNLPEQVMRQEEGQVVINYGDTQFSWPVSEDQSVEEVQKLVDVLIDYHSRKGTDNIYPLLDNLETLTQSDTAAQRDEGYALRSEILKSSGGIRSEIEFFDAGQRVTSLLGLGEYPIHRELFRLIFRRYSGVYDSANQLLDHAGEHLLREVNNEIFLGHMDSSSQGNNVLTSTYLEYLADERELSLAPELTQVSSALNWDVHMVWREQQELEDVIGDYEFKGNELSLITEYLNFQDVYVPASLHDYGPYHPDSIVEQAQLANTAIALADTVVRAGVDLANQDATPIYWAENALGTDRIQFADMTHRRAIGVAMIFQEHGLTEEQFLRYFEDMTMDDEVFGIIPRPVEEVLTELNNQ